MTAPLRLVAFDVDGTLVDSGQHIVTTMTRAFQAEGHPPPSPQEVVEIVGLALDEAMPRLAPDLAPERHDRLVAAYMAHVAEVFADTPPLFPGARAVLDDLGARDEVLLGVATGKSRRGLDQILAGHGMERRFLNIQTGDLHPSKPHPSMLLSALSETGVAAANAVMVGDTEYDIEMGRAAGVRTVGVCWGCHSGERLRAAGADVLIADFAQLPAALNTLWGI